MSDTSSQDERKNFASHHDDLIRRQEASHRRSLHRVTESLPIAQYRHDIVDAVRNNLVTIIVGETGSGKSTQIPQYLLDNPDLTAAMINSGSSAQNENKDNGNEEKGNEKTALRICITQPRRMAAIAMARRVADERHCELGHEVGYSIRFDDTSSPSETRIKYVTDGVALREVLERGSFDGYNIFMVDEAHERSLHTDILFSLIKKAINLKASNPLSAWRFVITSATLEEAKFSSFFNNAPILRIPGRCFPVDIFYTPITRSSLDPTQSRTGGGGGLQQQLMPSPTAMVDAAVNAALRLHLLSEHQGGGDGHILVFLTGQAECDAACEATLQRLAALVNPESEESSCPEVGDAIVIPLYDALASEDQALVFEPAEPGCRKIIFATNVAETSVTVEGGEFVVDLGLVKQKICNPKTGVETLSVVSIAKSQAIQRAGRAGRCRSGKCFRIYAEEQYDEFLDSPVLEINRTNLSSVVLQIKCLGFDDVLAVEFLDSPSKEALLASLKQLFLIGALTSDGTLTDLGRRMVSLPLEPLHARCLLAGSKNRVIEDVSAIVAMLSVDNIWIRPMGIITKEDGTIKRQHTPASERASQCHKRFAHPTGDHLTLLNVFKAFCRVPRSHRRQWCRDHFLQLRGLLQAKDIDQQLKSLMFSRKDIDDREKKEDPHYEGVTEYDGVQHRHDWKRHPRRSRSPPIRGQSSFHLRRQQQLFPEDRSDAILRSLCEGFFVNSAKLSSTSIVGSIWNGSQDHEDQDQRHHVWVTFKDGLLVRYDLGSCSLTAPSPEFVIFNEAIGWGADSSSSSTRRKSGHDRIGTIRIVSRVKREWLTDLISRFSKVDLRRLSKSVAAAAAVASDAEKDSPGGIVSTLFKVQTVEHPVEEPEESLKNQEIIEQHRLDARRRYLQRKAEQKSVKS